MFKKGLAIASVLVVATLSACGGNDGTADTASSTTSVPSTTTAPRTSAPPTTAGAPTTPSTTARPVATTTPASADGFSVTGTAVADRVASTDGPVKGDGRPDSAFRVRVSGPISDLVLYACKPDNSFDGTTTWDTIVGERVLPAGFYYSGQPGSRTWQLGVFDSGGQLLNASDGSLAARTVPAGTQLQLFVSDDGAVGRGKSFCLAIFRPDGSRSTLRA